MEESTFFLRNVGPLQLAVGFTLCLWVVLRTVTVLNSLFPSLSVSLSLFALLTHSLCFPTLHLFHPSLPDSWQSQPGIGDIQTSASRTKDL